MGKLHLDSVDRISNIPLVEKSVKRVENLYSKVKTNNRLFHWYFDTAEATILAAIESVQPAVKLFESPIRQLDNVLCKSLDILEERIPLVYLPPEMMYWNTKEYMSDRLVKPVLKRADSVKQIRNAVLESSLTTYAADRLDGAFTAGDKLVDKYLMPLDVGQDQTDGQNTEDDDNNAAAAAANEHGAMKAIHHGQRFSRKLKRRLTQRTILEARALKKQSKEAIHILLYAAELIATDPKLAMAKAKELWAYLSQDEPENQARPVTLEQLIVLITRESARRVVHLVNFSATLAAKVPKTLATTSTEVVHQMIYINKRLFVITKLDKVTNISKNEAESAVKRMVTFYDNLQGMTQIYLERLARFLSGRIEAEKIDNLSSNARRSAMALLSAPPSTTSTAPARRFENNPQEPHINGLC